MNEKLADSFESKMFKRYDLKTWSLDTRMNLDNNEAFYGGWGTRKKFAYVYKIFQLRLTLYTYTGFCNWLNFVYFIPVVFNPSRIGEFSWKRWLVCNV